MTSSTDNRQTSDSRVQSQLLSRPTVSSESLNHAATREDWLQATATMLRPLFDEKGITLPTSLRIACGWPLGRRLGRQGRSHAIGQCFVQKASSDGSSEIFISPELDNGVTVAAVLVHELIHAADDCRNGHRAPFRKMAIGVGLAGPMRATHAGPEPKARYPPHQSGL